MAAPGPFVFFEKARLNFVSATNLLNPANTYKLSLHTSTYVPNNATHEVFADVTNELAAGNGYTAGGNTLTNDALTQTGATVKFTADATVFTASGSGIPAWRYGVVYAVGTLNGKVNPVVGYFLGDSAPADVPLTTATNTLTITPNAAGILTVT